MTGWTAPLRRRLDLLDSPVDWFFRDDDAGRADPQLRMLVRVFADAGTTVDVAAIPEALSHDSIAALEPYLASGLVAVHQHGWAHSNHQLAGRRSEFGSDRPATDQADDLVRGARVLAGVFGDYVDPFFTPPWNRCDAVTAELLPGHGYTMLSCDRSAPRRRVLGLQELPVAVDWVRQWRSGGPAGLCDALTASIRDGELVGSPVGLMLHHGEMSPEEFAALTELLTVLRSQDGVALRSMRSLAQLHPSGTAAERHG
jgi:hypothetical protein